MWGVGWQKFFSPEFVSLLTTAAIKVVNYFKLKKQQNQKELDTAKQEIVEGINAYDAEHKDDESVEVSEVEEHIE